ncbi:MAG: cysteine--tRNA ligase [Gammaproteobacteria bacterium]
MKIHVYNTLTRKKEEFIPSDPERVTMYVCGPTVYSHPHIGNARPAVVFDTFFRLLQHEFTNVVYTRNITDVDDKINASALKENTSIETISKRFTEIYHQDMGALGVLPPTIEPRVTEHMPQIINMIKRLIDSGHAYEAEGHVLFDVPSYKEYGKLSGRDQKEMLAGARVEVAPFKRDPSDFVLWKPSTEDQPAWESSWGAGRPGWHIECSAMIEEHLGETIDIHGGGQDLVFPHHENERAQTTCVHGGNLFSRYWMHNGFVNVDQEKMSKSIGNVLLVKELLKQAPGEAIRVTLLSTHYRSPLDWTDDALKQSSKILDKLYGALQELQDVEVEVCSEDVSDGFLQALKDDLNTPAAFAELHKLAKRANTEKDPAARRLLKKQIMAAGNILGILQQNPNEWFQGEGDINESEIQELLDSRAQAKKDKNFGVADEIRDKVTAMGIQIQDHPDGSSSWRKL